MMNGMEQRPNSNISLQVIYTCGHTNASGLKNIPRAVSLELSGSFEGSQSRSRCHIPGRLTPLFLTLSLSGPTG